LINCSLIGFGKWGRKIYDSIQFHKGIKIKYICRNNIQNISRSENKINLVSSYKEAINDQVDTVFIATPSETHFEITKYALINKKNVFVEKPICFYNNEFQILKNLAKNNSTILHVNYIHIYNENFSSMVEIYKKNKNSKEISVKILLGNNGPIRENTSVLMDWGPHVFSMINYILDNHNYELIKSKIIRKSNNKMKYNIYLRFKYQNIYIYTLFGNDYKNKNTNVTISRGIDKFVYSDTSSNITMQNQSRINNFQNKSPLENSIGKFIKACEEKKSYENILLDIITYQLEKIQSQLFEQSF